MLKTTFTVCFWDYNVCGLSTVVEAYSPVMLNKQIENSYRQHWGLSAGVMIYVSMIEIFPG